ncbi:thermonuclease family protein [Synechococcus sp. MIT S9509]|uniref:thermonuclease family protein n=2 Tax=unclassified Synechococcus TaxID=2626047 RepID=UPI001E3FB718|nr:thermonuclease family protein [Synechococcus sp. MIT S9509]
MLASILQNCGVGALTQCPPRLYVVTSGGLVVGRQASLRQITRDHYGKTEGELFLNGSNVQQQMVASGHASIYWIYPHQSPWTR